ncbi:tryptophan synthase subunit alpha [Candidatus Sororendozoicomonas aggregata]|uniref:tryptophan synthase subunit alpha n=1 Tax=Candidatus Sororendozoicomonas aggregata TaxID=3073239 RepID=UPI002ED24C58
MRIKQCFEKLEAMQRKALIPYITAGDPHPNHTVTIMRELVASGGDIIELGFPFSDPMADGPVIAEAHGRALSHGVTLLDVFAMVARFRETDNVTPVVLMGYLNPIEMMGYGEFAERARAAGVDGVLVVDLPPEAAGRLKDVLAHCRLDIINLIAPTTPDQRIEKICAIASGYLYYVSLKGVTGSANLDVDAVSKRVKHIKRFTDLPVGVGFGIRDGQTAATIGKIADGVVVGSVLVSALAEYADKGDAVISQAARALAEMRTAMDT